MFVTELKNMFISLTIQCAISNPLFCRLQMHVSLSFLAITPLICTASDFSNLEHTNSETYHIKS